MNDIIEMNPDNTQKKIEAILNAYLIESTDIVEVILQQGNRVWFLAQWEWRIGEIAYEISSDEIQDYCLHMLSGKFSDLQERELELPNIIEGYNKKGHYNFRTEYKNVPLRANWSREQGHDTLQLRVIQKNVLTPDQLGIPGQVMSAVANYQKWGLIVVSAPTGEGKSTTIASVLQEFIRKNSINLVTLEDPIEYVFDAWNSIVRQREIGYDVDSYRTGIAACMRQTPSIVLVQEMTTPEIIQDVMLLLKKGCLVIATLHTDDTTWIFESIIHAFPQEERQWVAMQLRLFFRCFVSQRLLSKADLDGMVAAFEVMMSSAEVQGILQEGNFLQLRWILDRRENLSFSKSFSHLVRGGIITLDEALKKCPQARIAELQGLLGV